MHGRSLADPFEQGICVLASRPVIRVRRLRRILVRPLDTISRAGATGVPDGGNATVALAFGTDTRQTLYGALV